jgi:cystathionine gamma-lyase
LVANPATERKLVMAEGYKEQDPTFATRAIHVAQEPEQWESRAVVAPISLATTFKQDAPAEFRVRLFG